MARLVVLATGETALGFQLAGVEVICADDFEGARARLLELPDWEAVDDAPFFNEFPLRFTGDMKAMRAALMDEGILPGLDLMLQSLARGTAQLPLADGRFSLQPRCTVDAIRSGCLQAQAGAVERMFRQIADEPQALCLLGGGAADSFADLLEIPLRRADNLVLTGLGAIAHLPAPA